MWPLTQSFDFEGYQIAFDSMGEGDPMVLVHGTPFSSYVWRKIAPLLAEKHRVYAFDLLGYGQSEKPIGADVSLGVQNKVLGAFLHHTGIKTPHVIAHDFGGATALRAHLLDGVEYRKLLLVDPVAIRPWGSPFVQHVRTHEAAFAGVPNYIQEAILRAYVRGAIRRKMTEEELAPYIAPWMDTPGQAAFYQQIAQMDQRYTDEIEQRLGELRCPVRLLWGRDDEWIPIETGRRLAKLLPNCELSEISECGHLVQEDAPENIINTAVNFFD